MEKRQLVIGQTKVSVLFLGQSRVSGQSGVSRQTRMSGQTRISKQIRLS